MLSSVCSVHVLLQQAHAQQGIMHVTLISTDWYEGGYALHTNAGYSPRRRSAAL